jgi:hypothetical protein
VHNEIARIETNGCPAVYTGRIETNCDMKKILGGYYTSLTHRPHAEYLPAQLVPHHLQAGGEQWTQSGGA